MWRAAITLSLAIASCEDSGAVPHYVRLDGAAPRDLVSAGPTIVAFWATWCPPCREEASELRSFAQSRPSGIELITVSEDATLDEVRRFFGGSIPAELNLRLDDEHHWADAYRIDQLPAGVFVVNGRLVARFDGAQRWSSRSLRELLLRLSRERQAASP